MLPRRRLIGSLLTLAIVACDPCPDGEYTSVRDIWGNSTGDHVCIPNRDPPAEPTSTPPPDAPPTFIDMPDASASDAASTDASIASCTFLDAGSTDVSVVPKSGPLVEPDAGTDPLPPDGNYTLAQASAYPSGSTPFPVTQLRARLQVTGAKLVVGAQATTSSSREPNESFTFVLAGAVLTNVCASRAGSLSTSLFPGSAGSQVPARARWTAATGVLRLVVQAQSAEVELFLIKD